MDKEWTTREGQVTYLTDVMRRPGYLPALAQLNRCALRFYLCQLSEKLYQSAPARIQTKNFLANLHTAADWYSFSNFWPAGGGR